MYFFFNDTATTEIYTLSLHDALPIWRVSDRRRTAGTVAQDKLTGIAAEVKAEGWAWADATPGMTHADRSEEHTSELQSQSNLVCRLLLEKKKNHNHHDAAAYLPTAVE